MFAYAGNDFLIEEAISREFSSEFTKRTHLVTAILIFIFKNLIKFSFRIFILPHYQNLDCVNPN